MRYSRIAALALLISIAVTPLHSYAQVSIEAVPVIDGDGGCLMGGSIKGAWVKAAEMGTRMSGGDKYRLFNLSGEWKSMTGGKPESQGAPCDDTLFVKMPAEILDVGQAGTHYIGVSGKWNPMPRKPRLDSTRNPVYRNAVAALLKRKGIRRPQVNLTKVVRVDLEGDGTDEVIINATRVNRYEHGGITPDPKAGDYSVVMLRKMINGKVQTIMLDEEYHPKSARFTAPNEYKLIAVLDLNGDGVMEIINSGEYYEGNWKTVYIIQGNKAVDVLGCGCGA